MAFGGLPYNADMRTRLIALILALSVFLVTALGGSPSQPGRSAPPDGPSTNPSGKVAPISGKPGKASGSEANIQIQLSWELQNGLIQQSPEPIEFWCDNICVFGKALAEGKTCTACDDKCTSTHHLQMKGTSKVMVNDLIKAAEAIQASAAKAGFVGRVPASQLLDGGRDAVTQAVNASTMELNLDIPHFNTLKCTDRWRDYGYRKKPVMLTIKSSMVDKNGKSVDLGSQQVQVGELIVPDGNPYLDRSQGYCPCLLADDEDPWDDIYDELKDRYATPLDFWNLVVKPSQIGYDPGPDIHVRLGNGKGVSYDGPSDACSVEITGIDMNSLRITVINKLAQDLYFEIGPGAVFSTDPMVQRMMITKFKRMVILKALLGSSGTPCGLEAPSKTTFTVDTACIDMSKDPPHSGMVFKKAARPGEGLANLARNINRESQNGVGDQAKIWVLTDHATLPAIQERLVFPKITSGQYLNGLYDVSQLGAVDVSGPDFKACLTPDLVLGGDASPAPTRWLLSTFERLDAKRLADAIQVGVPSLVKDLAALSPKGKQHVADLAMALEESKNTDLNAACLALLEAIPADDRATLARQGGLKSFACLLGSSDDAIASRAVAVEKSYEAALVGNPLATQLKLLIDERNP